MTADALFESLRAALGRKRFQKPSTPPEPLLVSRNWTAEERLERFQREFVASGGRLHLVSTAGEARGLVAELVAGEEAVASSAPLLDEYGILGVEGVRSGFSDPELLRNACRTARIGIISCHCLLAEGGTVVLRSSPEQPWCMARGLPVTLILASRRQLLGNLDELLGMTPRGLVSASETALISGSEGSEIHLILISS
jgi:L-lactate utilization protein LutC